MGSFTPARYGVRARASCDGRSGPASDLCGDGTMALLDHDIDHGDRNGAEAPAREATTALIHLTALLSALDDDPANLARRLIHEFGSLSAVSEAPEEELRKCARAGECWIDAFLAVRTIIFDGMREQVIRTQLSSSGDELRRYLFASLRGLTLERLVAFFADTDGYILKEEILSEGNETVTSLSPRHIFRRALTLDCRRIVLAHNHPSGSSEPSRADIESTAFLSRHAKALGIVIDDHLIIGRQSIVSMRQRGLL